MSVRSVWPAEYNREQVPEPDQLWFTIRRIRRRRPTGNGAGLTVAPLATERFQTARRDEALFNCGSRDDRATCPLVFVTGLKNAYAMEIQAHKLMERQAERLVIQ